MLTPLKVNFSNYKSVLTLKEKKIYHAIRFRDHIYYVRLNYVKLLHDNHNSFHFGLFSFKLDAEGVRRFVGAK